MAVRLGGFCVRHRDIHSFSGQDFVIRISQFQQDLVLTRCQADENDRVPTGMSPGAVPVIDRDVYVAEMRRDINRLATEYRQDAQVFGAKLNNDYTSRQRIRQWWVNDELCCGFGSNRNHGGGTICLGQRQ